MSKQVADVLKKALEAFGPNGELWAQGTRKALSKPNCCSLTSFERAFKDSWFQPYQSGTAALRMALGVYDNTEIVEWNDYPKRTFPEVKALFEKAIKQELGVSA